MPAQSSHGRKAAILAARFFPTVTPSPETLVPPPPEERKPVFNLPFRVTPKDIQEILCSTKPWKATGEDLLPIGFLKALKEPFQKAFAVIGDASLQLGYFPRAFRKAIVVILPKPGKIQA